jgi:hypothetical protein
MDLESKSRCQQPQKFFGPRYKAEKYVELALKNPTPLAHRVASAMDWNYRKFDKAIAKRKPR